MGSVADFSEVLSTVYSRESIESLRIFYLGCFAVAHGVSLLLFFAENSFPVSSLWCKSGSGADFCPRTSAVLLPSFHTHLPSGAATIGPFEIAVPKVLVSLHLKKGTCTK
jgi:hypothetical protein